MAFHIERNLFKPYTLVTILFVWNRQVFEYYISDIRNKFYM